MERRNRNLYQTDRRGYHGKARNVGYSGYRIPYREERRDGYSVYPNYYTNQDYPSQYYNNIGYGQNYPSQYYNNIGYGQNYLTNYYDPYCTPENPNYPYCQYDY